MADVSGLNPWYQGACERTCPGLFELGEQLGSGAFATIVRATHPDSGFSCALKLTDKSRPELSDPRVLHRVRTEGRVLRRLTHVNIVQCFGAIESDALVALVLSCEPGFSLAEVVTTHGALAEPQAAAVTLQLARALHHCHQLKIAHRDVKLENVVYDNATGRAVLCDFGLALAVRSQGSRLDVRCGSHEYNAVTCRAARTRPDRCCVLMCDSLPLAPCLGTAGAARPRREGLLRARGGYVGARRARVRATMRAVPLRPRADQDHARCVRAAAARRRGRRRRRARVRRCRARHPAGFGSAVDRL